MGILGLDQNDPFLEMYFSAYHAQHSDWITLAVRALSTHYLTHPLTLPRAQAKASQALVNLVAHTNPSKIAGAKRKLLHARARLYASMLENKTVPTNLTDTRPAPSSYATFQQRQETRRRAAARRRYRLLIRQIEELNRDLYQLREARNETRLLMQTQRIVYEQTHTRDAKTKYDTARKAYERAKANVNAKQTRRKRLQVNLNLVST